MRNLTLPAFVIAPVVVLAAIDSAPAAAMAPLGAAPAAALAITPAAALAAPAVAPVGAVAGTAIAAQAPNANVETELSHLDPRTWEEWLLPIDSMGASPQPQAAACRIWVREVGDGPPVVFLHGGWGAEMSDLFYGLLDLADDARLVFYDQRGSLRSHCDELPTVDDHVADLEALRVALGLERLVLVGHSMGTRLAMLYADAHPDRVAGIAMVAPVWPTPDEPAVERGAPPWEDPQVIEELERHGLVLDRRREDGPVGWAINHRIIFAAVNLADPTRWRASRPPWAYDQEVANHTAASMPEEFDFRPALAVIDGPVLLLQGEQDFNAQATWADGMEGVERVAIEGAGHNAYTDRPDVVLPALRAFIREAHEAR